MMKGVSVGSGMGGCGGTATGGSGANVCGGAAGVVTAGLRGTGRSGGGGGLGTSVPAGVKISYCFYASKRIYSGNLKLSGLLFRLCCCRQW